MKNLIRACLVISVMANFFSSSGQSMTNAMLQREIEKATSANFNDSIKMERLVNLIAELISEQDSGAITAASRLIEISNNASSPVMTCKAYEFMGRSKSMQGRYKDGLNCFLTGLKVAEKYNLENEVAILSNNSGVNYLVLTRYDSAVYYYHQSLAIHEKLNHRKDVAKCQQNIAKVKSILGSYRESAALHLKALQIFKELKDTSSCISGYILIAEVYNGLSDYDSALLFLEQGEKFVIEFGDTIRMTDFYSVKGNSFKRAAQYDKAMLCYNRVLELSIAKNYNKGIADAYMNAGILFSYIGNPDSAYVCFVRGLEVAEKNNLKNEAAKLTMNVGSSLYNSGKYQLAYTCYLSALKLYKELNRQDPIGNVYTQLGLVQYKMKNYKEAVDYLKRGLEIRSASGNKILIGESHINLSMVYKDMGDFGKSSLHDSLALKWFEEAKNKRGIVQALNNKASSQFDAKNYTSSLKVYKEAQKISSEIPDQSGIIISGLGIAEVLIELKDYQGAKNEMIKILNEQEKIDTPDLKEIYWMLSIAEKNIATFSNDDSSRHESWKNAYDYLSLTKTIGDSLLNAESIRKVAGLEFQYKFDITQDSARTVYEKQLALAELEKQRALSESEKRLLLESISKQMEVDAAEKKRMVAESEKQMTILESDKRVSLTETARALEATRRTEAEAETQKQKVLRNTVAGGSGLVILSALLSFVFYKRKSDAEQKQKEIKLHLNISEMEMKALRSQMNPHFVFNALQSIQTFLISNKSEAANNYLLKFSKLMRAVLENSLHSEVPLKDDMQALELYMQLESIRLKHPFTYAIHISDDIDPETDTLPPLILQPFVENAIWHGLQYKSGPGHISIHISRDHNILKAVVEDNGIGRNKHKHVAHDVLLKKESLGMKLTEERLKVLNEVKKTSARFKIIDLFTSENQPSGTKVELSLPLVA